MNLCNPHTSPAPRRWNLRPPTSPQHPMTRQYVPYLLKGPKRGPFVKWYNPGLRPMTIKEAATFRSKQTEPASWGIEEVTPDTATLRAHAATHGQRIDPVWLENLETIEA